MMSGLVGIKPAADHEEPSSPTDLPDGGVDTSRSRLRLVPSSSSVVESEEARLEKELIDQIRAEAEEVSFEEVEREAEEAVRMTQTIEAQQHTHHDAPNSPRLRGPSLSPLEEAMMSQSAGQEFELGSPGTPPSPSAIPRHQRLYGYERQHGAKSLQARATPKRAQPRNLNAAATDSQQVSVTSIPTPRSANRQSSLRSSQFETHSVPSTSSASKPKQKPTQKPTQKLWNTYGVSCMDVLLLRRQSMSPSPICFAQLKLLILKLLIL